eukprot:CAMPEP_0176444520 /NCGR_PEP_ID=MMETSP0127-20121128/23112_1 /TAXON_ID=938130 /ORGANISM="Platyophrya macrostoma, Strain WH" /LENGTH=172 /DNA_ID=CAMNT_0017830045 /DNA_START=92 /DNA_END=610 /DNA_ORIENTATION=+
MNLLNYSTKDPEILTHNQKVTRLYRATLRKLYSFHLRGYRPEKDIFHRSIQRAHQDFEELLALEPKSQDYDKLANKYEDWLAKYYEPLMVLEECRPYASTSGRYLIWADGVLGFDPFGYYSHSRLTSEKRPDEFFPYFEVYPMNDSKWGVGEIFDIEFDDTDYERLYLEKRA